MARATDSRMQQIQAGIAQMEKLGYPEELREMFTELRAVWDNADRLVALFGVVDRGSADKAWELFNAFMAQKNAASRPTVH